VLLYNYARFDSPFSFGQNYNLTDTNAAVSTSQKLSLSNFFTGIFQYFLDMPEFFAHFPFINPEKHFHNLIGLFMIFNGEMPWIYQLAPETYAQWFNLFLL
jgi:hypothetical protein